MKNIIQEVYYGIYPICCKTLIVINRAMTGISSSVTTGPLTLFYPSQNQISSNSIVSLFFQTSTDLNRDLQRNTSTYKLKPLFIQSPQIPRYIPCFEKFPRRTCRKMMKSSQTNPSKTSPHHIVSNVTNSNTRPQHITSLSLSPQK